MERRGLLAALVVLFVSSLVLTGTAMAHKSPVRVEPAAAEAPAGECSVRTLPSFVDQGEFGEAGSIADVLQVSCEPVYAGQMVKISSQELYSRCGGHLTWSAPYPYSPVSGTGFSVQLDDVGNATAVLWAGPSCASGESLISVHLVDAPYTTSTTSFVVLPPASSPPGVTATPAGEIEDTTYGSVGTIVQVEFPSVDAERRVDINAEQLYARCLVAPHLTWVGADAKVLGEGETVEVKLDNDGNAFVVLLGGASCASGSSEIEASLVEAPYTTYTTNFTVIPPQPMEKPAFAIEKLQQIQGPGSGYSAGPLTGKLGQTVDYEIVVRNTGPVAETFAEFHDAHCDPGTIAGGPGSSQVAPREATTYTCSHVLTSVGSYVNEATVTGSSADGTRVTHTSNQVVVDVPAEPAFTIEKLQEISGVGTAFTSSPLTGKLGQTVDYEVLVTNTGNEPLMLSGFTDAHCDAGTIGGGPGEAPLQPGAAATYTCSHVLTSVGSYVNEASVTGTPQGEAPIIHTSHPVEVNVPPGGAYFTVEKLQELAGSAGFTTSPVTGTLGQTVDYEIIVTNAGDVALTFSGFTDPHCDAGTIAGGPGEAPLQPGASTTYTCSHVLNSVGSYVNEATVTGTPQGEAPITQTSNAVAAVVPAQAPAPIIAASSPSTPGGSGVAAVCELSEPAIVLRGASGPKRATFAVQIRSAGIKQITFYLDGRKLKTLRGSQAKGGKFTIAINPAKLSYGAHKVSATTVMIDSNCKPLARSSVFVRPHAARITPKFTG